VRVYAEESFGPLAAIVAVDGPDDGMRVANDTEYGLAAAVFSENVQVSSVTICAISGPRCSSRSAALSKVLLRSPGVLRDQAAKAACAASTAVVVEVRCDTRALAQQANTNPTDRTRAGPEGARDRPLYLPNPS
jgi:hypothetical protein